MEPKQHQSNPFAGALAICLYHIAAAVLWIVLLPFLIGDATDWKTIRLPLQLIGALVAILFGVQHLLLRAVHFFKHINELQNVENGLVKDFRDFVEEIPTNIAIISNKGRYKYWSRSFQRNIMPDLSDKEISGIDVFHKDFSALQLDGHPFPYEARPIIQALNTGAKVSNVTMGLSVGLNLWAWVGVTITPRKDADGNILDFVCVFQLISDVHTTETDLTLLTFQDRLTGLPNRSFFTELLSKAIFMMKKRGSRIAVLFVDLNRFKIINDTLGHQSGDLLLSLAAKRIRGAVRHGDTVARIGGDEFAILFEELAELSEAVLVSDMIKNAIEEPFMLGGEECYIGCSQGLAVSNRLDISPNEMLRDAEVAMYRAKSRGSQSLEIYDQTMNDQTRGRLKLESEMRRGLPKNEFMVFYQPLVAIATGKICGWEALARWMHPERGIVSPVEFINLAEETGLIMALGAWILDESCHQAQVWREKYLAYSESVMSVNLSMRQFQQPNLTEKIVGILEKHRLEPRLLKLEITESTAMKDAGTSFAIMTALKALKINLAIDDFGTDYSSLSYLKRLPVDTLKIDKSFIDGLGIDHENTAIVQAILSLAKSLELRVTAEGIESAEQLALLKDLGCDIGQGYYFSRPLPPNEAEKLMEQNISW
jgi:diguanylate cyclase (GGDEF)-like protein